MYHISNRANMKAAVELSASNESILRKVFKRKCDKTIDDRATQINTRFKKKRISGSLAKQGLRRAAVQTEITHMQLLELG
jgi:hypothetical protein